VSISTEVLAYHFCSTKWIDDWEIPKLVLGLCNPSNTIIPEGPTMCYCKHKPWNLISSQWVLKAYIQNYKFCTFFSHKTVIPKHYSQTFTLVTATNPSMLHDTRTWKANNLLDTRSWKEKKPELLVYQINPLPHAAATIWWATSVSIYMYEYIRVLEWCLN
jgi:hypothetical protein